MFMPRFFCLTFAMVGAATLSACGGGGMSVSELGSVRAQSTSNETVAASQTLVLGSAGLSGVAAGSYPVDDTDAILSQSMDLSFGTLVIVYPGNSNFDTSVIFMQEQPGKFFVGFVSRPETGEQTYACRSSAWTTDELNEVATEANDSSALTMPVCSKAIALNATNRSVTYSDLTLVSANNSSDQVVISATYSWPVPEPIVFDTEPAL